MHASPRYRRSLGHRAPAYRGQRSSVERASGVDKGPRRPHLLRVVCRRSSRPAVAQGVAHGDWRTMNAAAPPLPPPANPKSRRMANALRALAMDAVENAKSGHPGMPMGMADIATVLFTEFLRFDPRAPDWADRDRFVLSN